jgi:hypothetical protein
MSRKEREAERGRGDLAKFDLADKSVINGADCNQKTGQDFSRRNKFSRTVENMNKPANGNTIEYCRYYCTVFFTGVIVSGSL